MASLTRSLKTLTALNSGKNLLDIFTQLLEFQVACVFDSGMTAMASRALATQAGTDLAFKTLKVTQVNDSNGVFHVELNRPEKRNAMSPTWFA